jgi:hypothetical protein
MRRLGWIGAVAGLLLAVAPTVFAATSNLNLSKSNIYRLTYHSALLTEAQAKAMLAELDRFGPMSEARMKQWLPANFKRFGVDPARVKKTVFLPAGKAAKEAVILLLADPADEAAALATSVKSSKSNSSD